MSQIKKRKETLLLALICALTSVLGFVNLGNEGTANSYYAAAVKSMTLSFKNFFFVAFDPSGFVSIDKPPLGFWFQAISAKVFGVNAFGIMLPQVLASIGCVILIYFIVKKAFGSAAGLLSSFFLAITPVFVALSRNNSVDNILVFFLLLACFYLTRAAQKGKLGWLLLAAAFIGVGFNVKQLQAYMVVPAIYITYLLTSSIPWKKRILHLTAAAVIMVVVSLSWATVVDITPASLRPYVDSSTNNSELELIVGHNGIERLTGSSQGGAPGGQASGGKQNSTSQGAIGGIMPTPPGQNASTTSGGAFSAYGPGGFGGFGGPGNQGGPGFGGQTNGTMPTPPGQNANTTSGGAFSPNGSGGPSGQNGTMPTNPGQGNTSGGMGGNSQLSGTFGAQVSAGVTRLFTKSILCDQISWLILFALLGFIAAAVREKLTWKLNTARKQTLSLWILWLIPVFLYFSFTTGTFHSYYLTMLAPPIAALSGIGLTTMWEMMKAGGKGKWLLPTALLINGAFELVMLLYFSGTALVTALTIIFCLLTFGGAGLLFVLNAAESDFLKAKKLICGLAVAGMCLAPLAGSAAVMFVPLNGSFPAAGIELLMSGNQNSMKGNMSGPQSGTSDTLVSFLLKNKTAAQKYLLVVPNSNSAADLILKTGQPVMSLGGFLGSDNILTLDQFKALVADGEIRYVMTGGQGGSGNDTNSIISWVEQYGTKVSASEYSGSSETSSSDDSTSSSTTTLTGAPNMNASGTLYDLKNYTDSLK